jgi:hypothetical protein
MPTFTRTIAPAERPGRLHLAILEWQRQLIERKRPLPTGGGYRGPLSGADRP